MEGRYTAVVDRIVDGEMAVLLLEDDDEVIEQFDVSTERLPAECDEGSIVSVVVADDELIEMTLRPEETRKRRERIREKFNRLAKRLGDEDE